MRAVCVGRVLKHPDLPEGRDLYRLARDLRRKQRAEQERARHHASRRGGRAAGVRAPWSHVAANLSSASHESRAWNLSLAFSHSLSLFFSSLTLSLSS